MSFWRQSKIGIFKIFENVFIYFRKHNLKCSNFDYKKQWKHLIKTNLSSIYRFVKSPYRMALRKLSYSMKKKIVLPSLPFSFNCLVLHITRRTLVKHPGRRTRGRSTRKRCFWLRHTSKRRERKLSPSLGLEGRAARTIPEMLIEGQLIYLSEKMPLRKSFKGYFNFMIL